MVFKYFENNRAASWVLSQKPSHSPCRTISIKGLLTEHVVGRNEFRKVARLTTRGIVLSEPFQSFRIKLIRLSTRPTVCSHAGRLQHGCHAFQDPAWCPADTRMNADVEANLVCCFVNDRSRRFTTDH